MHHRESRNLSGEPLDFRYIEANPAFAAQTGVGDVVGRTIRQAFPGEPEEWYVTYDDVLRTGRAIRFERELVTRGLELELYAFRVEGEAGRCVAVVFKDITERKRAEGLLRESQERFRGLFHSAPMAVFVCDRAGVVQAYNSYAAELWGREPVCGDPNEVNCGSMLLRHPNGELLPHAESPIVDVLRTGEPHHGAEVIIERPDGSKVSVLVNFAPLKDARGEVTGAITSFIDITGQKQREEELREAARLKDDLLGLVAHEFRTPLTTITGNIDVLVRRFNELPAESRDQALLEIQRGSDRLRRLIQNMLVVARGERGKDEELEPILLQRTLEAIVASEQERDPSRPITLAASPALPPVVASAGYLEQVVENLITNARKYGHIATSIEVSAVADGETAVVSVRDHGDVLDEEKVGRFFEPFYRSEDVPSQIGGAGLGLAVCATLVDRMEGKIWARPNPGGGLEALFSLPLAYLGSDE